MNVKKINTNTATNKSIQKGALVGGAIGAAVQGGWGVRILKFANPGKRDVFLKNMEGKINPDRAIELYDEAKGAYNILRKSAAAGLLKMTAIGLGIGAGIAFAADKIKNYKADK